LHLAHNNLKDLPDLTLVSNIQQGTALADESIIELSSRHSGLFYSTVAKISGACQKSLRDDVLDDKLFAVYDAATSFNPDRGTSFSTHFANVTKWKCLKGKSQKCNAEICCDNDFIDSLNTKRGDFATDHLESDDSFIKSAIELELKQIDDKTARKIISLRYSPPGNKNLSWKKVAKAVQLSIQGCINIHNRYIEQIRRNIKEKYKEQINEH